LYKKLENNNQAFLMSEEIQNNSYGSEQWDYDAEQNWLGFWDLILKEDMRQNPHFYQKSYENNRDTNNPNKA